MKRSDVPQDKNRVFEGGFKAMYAVDDQGQYVVTPSSGWEVEEIVTTMAVEEFERLAGEARSRVEAGTSSPLEYHMYARRMDVPTLAGAVGKFRWSVRRHLRPAAFARLNARTLEAYADALGLSVAELCELPR